MGKLGWTEQEFYNSSPYMFFAACEGYFDKQKEHILLLRQVALFASQRSGDEFNRAWPNPFIKKEDIIKKTWGSIEEANEFRKQINDAWAKR